LAVVVFTHFCIASIAKVFDCCDLHRFFSLVFGSGPRQMRHGSVNGLMPFVFTFTLPLSQYGHLAFDELDVGISTFLGYYQVVGEVLLDVLFMRDHDDVLEHCAQFVDHVSELFNSSVIECIHFIDE